MTEIRRRGSPQGRAFTHRLNGPFTFPPPLCSGPQMKSVVRKLGVPIYTLRSTSSSSIYRDLCPLLGLNPMTANTQSQMTMAASSAAAVAGSGLRSVSSYDSSGSMDEDGGEERPGARPVVVSLTPHAQGQGLAHYSMDIDLVPSPGTLIMSSHLGVPPFLCP